MVTTIKVKSVKPPPAMIRWNRLQNGEMSVNIINASRRFTQEDLKAFGILLKGMQDKKILNENGKLPLLSFFKKANDTRREEIENDE